MDDIKIVSIKELLPIAKVELMEGFSPPSIIIRGEDFLRTEEVTINDMPSPEFVIESNTKIFAQIPDSQRRGFIRSISVLTRTQVPGSKSVLEFEFGDRKVVDRVSGLQKLVQQYVKLLIQTPGTDIFHPDRGGGLKSLIGRSVPKRDSDSVTGSVVFAVGKARDQLISIQSKISSLPPDERLMRADTRGIGFNPNTTTLTARVSVGAVSGREAVTNLIL